MKFNIFEKPKPILTTPTSDLELESIAINSPELALRRVREAMKDPNYLPSYKVLSKCLRNFQSGAYRQNIEEARKWDELVEDKKRPIFEIWTKEYINSLSNYLKDRIKELGGSKKTPITILEVGAGDGRLAHFIQERLNKVIPGHAKVVASDSGDWEVPPAFSVENITNKEAVEKYKPKVVICSWMPYNVDFTADFRQEENVDEYILIGEADSGCCGDEWYTWGFMTYDENSEELHKDELAPYEKDGFEKTYHEDLNEFQLSRKNIKEGENFSETVSFRRKKKVL
jgi:hypothetical protein